MDSNKKTSLLHEFGIDGMKVSDADLTKLEKLSEEKSALTAMYAEIRGFFQNKRRKEIQAKIDEVDKQIKTLIGEIISANGNAAAVNAAQNVTQNAAADLKGTLFKSDSIHIYLTGKYSIPIRLDDGTSVDLEIVVINNSQDTIHPSYSCEINGWTVSVYAPWEDIKAGTKIKQEISIDLSQADIDTVQKIKTAMLTTRIDEEIQTVNLAYKGTKFISTPFETQSSGINKPVSQNGTLHFLKSEKVKAYFTGKFGIHTWLNRDDTLKMDTVVENDTDHTIDIDIKQIIINGYMIQALHVPGYNLPSGSKCRDFVDIDFRQAGIMKLSEIKDMLLKVRAIDSESQEVIVETQEVKVVFKGSTFTVRQLETDNTTEAKKEAQSSQSKEASPENGTLYFFNSKSVKGYFTSKARIKSESDTEEKIILDTLVINNSRHTIDLWVVQVIVNDYVVEFSDNASFKLPPSLRENRHIDITFTQAGIKEMSEIKRIKIKSVVKDDATMDILVDEQEVEIFLNGTTITTSPLPEVDDEKIANEIASFHENSQLMLDHYNCLMTDLLPKAYKASDVTNKKELEDVVLLFDIILQNYLYRILLNNDLIDSAVALIDVLTDNVSLCTVMEGETEDIQITDWEDVSKLEKSDQYRLQGYFQRSIDRISYILQDVFSGGTEIDDLMAKTESEIQQIVFYLAKCVGAEIKDLPAFLPPKKAISQKTNISASQPVRSDPRNDVSPTNNSFDTSRPKTSGPETARSTTLSTDQYVRLLYTCRTTVHEDRFSFDVPSGWLPRNIDGAGCFITNNPEIARQGLIIYRLFDENIVYDPLVLQAYYNNIYHRQSWSSSAPEQARCRSIEIAHMPALRFRYVSEGGSYTSALVINHNGKTLYIEYSDGTDNFANLNALMDAITGSVKVSIEEDSDIQTKPLPDALLKYHFADHSQYDCLEAENSLRGDQLIIDGIVVKHARLQHWDFLIVQQKNGKKWHVVTGSNDESVGIDSSMFNGLLGSKVRIFGEYRGYSKPFQLPDIQLMKGGFLVDVDKDKVIQTALAKKNTLEKGITEEDILEYSHRLALNM